LLANNACLKRNKKQKKFKTGRRGWERSKGGRMGKGRGGRGRMRGRDR